MRTKRAPPKIARRAESELEVEPAADREDEVGLAHHRAAHRGDDEGCSSGTRPRLSPVSR